jgi:6-phosphofructokinase 1
MGRDCGYLALMSGIAGGTEAIAIPEVETSEEALANEVRSAFQRGKSHAIIVVSEDAACNADRLEGYFVQHHDDLSFELRVTKLGHVQRGGAPGAFDRLLGSRLGAAAVASLASREHGLLTDLVGGDIATTPLVDVVAANKGLGPTMIELARVLAI